jgi:hypothetical protein
MFRPYKLIQRSKKKTDPRAVNVSLYCGFPFWIPQYNATLTTLGSVFLGGPEDDFIRSKHVALTKYTIFVYK